MACLENAVYLLHAGWLRAADQKSFPTDLAK